MKDNYAKIDVPYHESDVSWVRVPAALFSGFCAGRKAWPEGTYCFLVKSAQYSAQDGVIGMLDRFLVKRLGRQDIIYIPSEEDEKGEDWELYTRQQTHAFPRYEERETRPLDTEVVAADDP